MPTSNIPGVELWIWLCCVSIYLALDKSRIEELRIAFATAAPTPMRAYQTEAKLRGKDYRSISLADIGKMAAAEANPRSSWRASRNLD